MNGSLGHSKSPYYILKESERYLCNQGYEVSYTVVLTEKLQQLKKYQEMDGITRNKSLRIPINKI
jgi:hypothetical protein